MASFDVTSLFTNIPLSETIEMILELAFKENDHFHNFDKKKLLNLPLLENYFIFNEKLFQQCDGLAMGSPIVPSLANVFFL